MGLSFTSRLLPAVNYKPIIPAPYWNTFVRRVALSFRLWMSMAWAQERKGWFGTRWRVSRETRGRWDLRSTVPVKITGNLPNTPTWIFSGVGAKRIVWTQRKNGKRRRKRPNTGNRFVLQSLWLVRLGGFRIKLIAIIFQLFCINVENLTSKGTESW